MAVINKLAFDNNSKKSVQLAFLRNNNLYNSKEEAIEGLKKAALNNSQDGILILARYIDNGSVNTILGILYSKDDDKSITIFGSGETISLKENKNKKLFYEELYEIYGSINELCSAYSD